MRLPHIKHGKVLPTPEKVVRARLNRGQWEVLVQWLSRSAADATWEPLQDFSTQYPDV
uniref:Chromo domain-containing protein n=1 Tax=Arundo donax TaxID=35708 RepID=A0A0A9I3B8_ARUDO